MLLDLPSKRDEAWRWSDLAAIEKARSLQRIAGVVDCTGIFLPVDGPRLVFVDGYYDPDFSDPAGFEPEVVDHVASDHPLARRIGAPAYRIRFGEGLPRVVQLLHATVGGEDHMPLRIDVDDGADGLLIESFTGEGWTNRLNRIEVGCGARLERVVRLNQRTGFASLRDETSVGKDGRFASVMLAVGAGGSRLDGAIELAGDGAAVDFAGVLLARGEQRHDAQFVVRHSAPCGTSRQLWRSVADDQATCSVAARVEVARGAQKTDGEQSLKGIMLSRTATINAKPELEIFADDVKCAHGATVGELDRNALFYLASRGVPEPEAKALLTRAFVADAIDRIGDETVRAAFEADVEGWFARHPFVSSEVETRFSTSLEANGEG